jgi:predicted AlkP superfamily phosphohydrolase/phosphomutase
MKLAIIGLDGLFPAFASAFAGELSNLLRIATRGVSSPLLSTIPPYTPQAWSTMLTGVNPGAHGIASFTRREGSRDVPLTTDAFCARRLDEYLTERGVRVGLLNVPVLFPAPRVQGFAISGMLAPSPRAEGFTYPADLGRQLAAEVPDYVIDVAVTKSEAHDEGIWHRFDAMLDARIRAARFLIKRFPVDVFFGVFVVLDRTFHLAFRYFDPDDPLYETRRAAAARAHAVPLLKKLDTFIGEVAAGAERILIVSDHGFRREEGKFYTNRFLADRGFISIPWSLRQAVIDRAVGLVGSSVLRRVLPRRLIERRIAATGAGAPSDAKARAAPLVAQGILVENEELRGRITDALRAAQDPRDGSPLASAVYRREDVYRGPALERFPHIVLELKENGIEASPHLIGRNFLRLAGDDWPGGHHDRRGFIALAGKDVKGPAPGDAPHMVDVLPTVFSLLDLPCPEGCEGRPWPFAVEE